MLDRKDLHEQDAAPFEGDNDHLLRWQNTKITKRTFPGLALFRESSSTLADCRCSKYCEEQDDDELRRKYTGVRRNTGVLQKVGNNTSVGPSISTSVLYRIWQNVGAPPHPNLSSVSRRIFGKFLVRSPNGQFLPFSFLQSLFMDIKTIWAYVTIYCHSSAKVLKIQTSVSSKMT